MLMAGILYSCKSNPSTTQEPSAEEISAYEKKVEEVTDSMAIKASEVEAAIDELLKDN